jgi:FHA domain
VARPDVDGLQSLTTWRRVIQRGGTQVLEQDCPALVLTTVVGTKTRAGGEELAYSRTLDQGEAEQGNTGGSPKDYDGKVAFLRKRPGNPFPHMISVGRARNHDVCLALGTVSKVQCYFIRGADGWSVVDQRSRNGTYLNGERLVPSRPAPLRDGDELRLGEEILAKFLHTESFVDSLACAS